MQKNTYMYVWVFVAGNDKYLSVITCVILPTTVEQPKQQTTRFLVQHHQHPPSVQTRVGEIHECYHDSSHQDAGLDENGPKKRISKGRGG